VVAPKEIIVIFDDGKKMPFTLTNTPYRQTIKINPPKQSMSVEIIIKSNYDVNTKKAKTTGFRKIEIVAPECVGKNDNANNTHCAEKVAKSPTGKKKEACYKSEQPDFCPKEKCHFIKANTFDDEINNNLCKSFVTSSSDSQWSREKTPKCIVEAVSESTSPADKVKFNKAWEKSNFTDLCTTWNTTNDVIKINSDNKFNYNFNAGYKTRRVAKCIKNNCSKTGTACEVNLLKGTCTEHNNVFENKYKYSDSSHCNSSMNNINMERELVWTGGDISIDDNNNWTKECGSSILGSCNVKCNHKYGGGGVYTCHYNNHASDTCGDIENRFTQDILIPKAQQTTCEQYPNCKWQKALSNQPSPPPGIKDIGNGKWQIPESKRSNGIVRKAREFTKGTVPARCEVTTNKGDEDLIKGQPEWMGTPCYQLNNDAFHHGISNLSSFDEMFPPFPRLLAFFGITLLISFILYRAGIIRVIMRILIFIASKLKDFVKGGGHIVFKLGKTGGIFLWETSKALGTAVGKKETITKLVKSKD